MHTGVLHPPDLTAQGKTLGYLAMPFSIDRSPYYQVQVPWCRLCHGSGARVLLMAGNHGDEYEGELTLARLMRRLRPEQVRGEVTILPMANVPAVMAARRRSPLDNGNLNRAFPGDPAGSPTPRLADYLERTLFAQHDVVFDLHAGGASLAHLPCALIERHGPPARFDRALDLMLGLGLAYGFVADNGPDAPTSMAAAARAGVIGLSGEFGGAAGVTPATMLGAARAVDALLGALGIVDAPVLAPEAPPPAAPMQLLALDRAEQSLFATRRGWFEPAVALGASVEVGAVAGWYHDLARLEAEEETLHFRAGGIVISHRQHADCEAGDCLLQVGRPVSRSDLHR